MSTPESTLRLDSLLRESDSVASFLKECVVKVDKKAGDIASFELLQEYGNWCEKEGITPLPDRSAQIALRAAVSEQFQVNVAHDLRRGECRTVRGYRGLQFISQTKLPFPDGSDASDACCKLSRIREKQLVKEQRGSAGEQTMPVHGTDAGVSQLEFGF